MSTIRNMCRTAAIDICTHPKVLMHSPTVLITTSVCTHPLSSCTQPVYPHACPGPHRIHILAVLVAMLRNSEAHSEEEKSTLAFH